MAKIDKTVFTAQIEAVNTILQLCYTLRDYGNSLIEQGNLNVDDIATLKAQVALMQSNIEGLGGLYQQLQEFTNHLNDNINNLSDVKLDKLTGVTGQDLAYVKLADGTQSSIPIDDQLRPLALVKRNANGGINCATPAYDNNAANKKYVDDNIPPKEYKHSMLINLSDGTNGYSCFINIKLALSTQITTESELINNVFVISHNHGTIYFADITIMKDSDNIYYVGDCIYDATNNKYELLDLCGQNIDYNNLQFVAIDDAIIQ